jgi:hypothetical protein
LKQVVQTLERTDGVVGVSPGFERCLNGWQVLLGFDLQRASRLQLNAASLFLPL